MDKNNKAIFFDRDGTLIKSVHYLNHVDQIELFPETARILKEVAARGYLRIIVTNQAAIGKGLLTNKGLFAIQRHLRELLKAQGADFEAWYFSPLASKINDRETIEHLERKPGPGMLLSAAQDHGINLSRSIMVGDMISDTLAGRNAGCLATVLLEQKPKGIRHHSVDFTIPDIAGLIEIIDKFESQKD